MFIKNLITLVLFVTALHATEKPYWIFLKAESSPRQVEVTPRAVQRLIQRGSDNFSGTPVVSESQLAQLRASGYRIRHVSRFLNAVSVDINTPDQLNQLEGFPFVKSTTPVARYPHNHFESITNTNGLNKGSTRAYGQSTGQNEMLNIPQIHSKGYDGSGILVGVFDTGFLTDHPVFDGIDILAQHDFVDHEADASGPGYSHGTNVLSVLAGYYPGELIGPAYGATFLLARTEDVFSESRAEEDNWVAALEWADSLGVDIISTSLNYFLEFDDPSEDYPQSALDGQTTIIARAANIAAARGILVVNSAGNEGSSASSIWPPSDSPHVLSVGAVDSQHDITYFSSRGPTYDDRIKPNVVAQGSNVYMASGVNGFTLGNGTSFAAPQIAGLAALLLQANPHFSPDSVISLFQRFGDRAEAPNNTYGWGIPDLSSLFSKSRTENSRNCLVYPNPGQSGEIRMVLSDAVTELSELATLHDIQGREIASLHITQESVRVIKIYIPPSMSLASQIIILSVKADERVYAGKFVFLNL